MTDSGIEGVQALLGEERSDESGDVTRGAGLSQEKVARVFEFIRPDRPTVKAWTRVAEAGQRPIDDMVQF